MYEQVIYEYRETYPEGHRVVYPVYLPSILSQTVIIPAHKCTFQGGGNYDNATTKINILDTNFEKLSQCSITLHV